MNNDKFKFWLDNDVVPDVLEGIDKETLISYLPILLENSLVDPRRVLQGDEDLLQEEKGK